MTTKKLFAIGNEAKDVKLDTYKLTKKATKADRGTSLNVLTENKKVTILAIDT